MGTFIMAWLLPPNRHPDDEHIHLAGGRTGRKYYGGNFHQHQVTIGMVAGNQDLRVGSILTVLCANHICQRL
jgi:hypothetical protein